MFKSSYAHIVRRTLFSVAIAYVILMAAFFIVSAEFDAEGTVFVLPFILIPVLIGLALGKWSGKTQLLGVLAGVVLVIVNIPFRELVNPTSTIDFSYQAIGVFGGIILVIAGVRAFMGRKSAVLPSPSMPVSSLFAALIVVPAVVGLAGLVGWIAGDSDISDEERAGAVVVNIEKFDFFPMDIAAGAGSVLVSNDDVVRHAFTVDDLDIDVSINPGRETIVDLSGTAPGTYDVTCSIPGHESMEAKLVLGS